MQQNFVALAKKILIEICAFICYICTLHH